MRSLALLLDVIVEDLHGEDPVISLRPRDKCRGGADGEGDMKGRAKSPVSLNIVEGETGPMCLPSIYWY